MLICRAYIMWPKQSKPRKVPTMFGSIIVVSVLAYYALLHFLCNLKAEQINVLHGLIWKLMLYEFKMDHNAAEAAENICCVKSESTIGYDTMNRWFKKFCLGYKNLNNQERSELLNWASFCQNIAKVLTHPSEYTHTHTYEKLWICLHQK